MRRSALLLLAALASAQDAALEQSVAKQVADAHARGDRARIALLAAEPPLRVRYARVVDGLLRQGFGPAAEALARERQGPEAQGLARMIAIFKAGQFPQDATREEFRRAVPLLDKDPEAALRILGDLRAAEGTLFAAEVSWARASALDALQRKEETCAELERCATLSRAIGEWSMVRDAEEQRLRRSGDPAAADRFLEAAKLLDDHPATIRALCARARVRTAEGRRLKEAGKPDEARLRWKEAHDDYLTASDLAERDRDRLQQGRCWRENAMLWYSCEGQPNEALKQLDRAIQLLRGAAPEDELDATVYNAALILTDLARYDDALRRLDELLATGRSAVRARALEQKATVLGRLNRLRSAHEAYTEALEAVAPADRARLLVAKGELELARMDPDAALRSFEKALELAPDHSGAWAGRAYAFGLRGDGEEARRSLAGAVQREKDPGARARILLAAAQMRVYGGLDEATELAEAARACVMDVNLGQYVTAGAAWHTVAELAALRNDREKAAEHLAKASTIFYNLRQPTYAIPLYAEETLLLLMLERKKDATERLQVLLRMAETTPNDALKCEAKSAQALFEAEGGRGDRAHALLDEAQALARTSGDRVREATVLVNRAALDPEGASGHVREAMKFLDEDRLFGPREIPLIHGYSPDWGPGIALDAILKSGKEQPEDAFLFLERALGRRTLLGLRGRDAVLAAGLSPEQHGRCVAVRADLVEARATGTGVAAAEKAFDAMVARLRAEAPLVAALAWPREPPLVEVQKALRPDEALVMTLFDPYLDCALVIDQKGAVLRRATTYEAVKDLLKGKRTVLLASSAPADAFAAPATVRLCQVPTAAVLLAQRAAARPRGTGVALLGEGPAVLGAPVERLPAGRLLMVYLGNGVDLSPLRLLRQRIDADTVVIASPGGPLALPAAALLAAGVGNVVVGGRPRDPLDFFLDACLKRQLSALAAFHEASAKGPLFFYGAPE